MRKQNQRRENVYFIVCSLLRQQLQRANAPARADEEVALRVTQSCLAVELRAEERAMASAMLEPNPDALIYAKPAVRVALSRMLSAGAGASSATSSLEGFSVSAAW